MLSWDEEVTPTAVLPPSSSRTDPLIAARFSGPAAPLSEATDKPNAAPFLPRMTAPATDLAADNIRTVNAADKHTIHGKTVNFTQTPALGGQTKPTGASQHCQYVLRDESMHCNFGIDLVNHLNFEALIPNEENPFPWVSEMIDLKKERSFFETRVTDYQSCGMLS